MRATQPDSEEDPQDIFVSEKINELLKEVEVIEPSGPVLRSRNKPDWHSEAPKTWEQVEKIQAALLPAIEDFAAYTRSPVPEWQEGQEQTIWGSYDQQHARLQHVAEEIYNRKSGKKDAHRRFQLRHWNSNEELPLRHKGSAMMKYLPKVLPSMDPARAMQAQTQVYSQAGPTPPSSQEILDSHRSPWVHSQGPAGFTPVPLSLPTITITANRGVDPAIIRQENAKIDLDNAKLLSFYPEAFTTWLTTRAFDYYMKHRVFAGEWDVWCKVVAPTVFAHFIGLKEVERLPKLMRPWPDRGQVELITLEQAKRGNLAWRANRHDSYFHARKHYPALKPEQGLADSIFSAWQASQAEKNSRDQVFRAGPAQPEAQPNDGGQGAARSRLPSPSGIERMASMALDLLQKQR